MSKSRRHGLTVAELKDLLIVGKKTIGECTIYRWIANSLIPYVNGRIPTKFAKKLKRNWERTCTPSEAARILGVSTTKIDNMLNEGCFQEMTVVSKKRILRKSVQSVGKKFFVVRKEDIAYPDRRGFARLTKTKLSEISRKGNESFKRKIAPNF